MPTMHKPSAGLIDVTIMYSTHDAFRHDLARLSEAANTNQAGTPHVQAGWENFKRQLRVHHTVEDAVLWPRLASAVSHRPLDAALVADMEAEHAELDPLLAAVDQAMAHRSADLPGLVQLLAQALGDHMGHEENSALPLIQQVLTPKDWSAFRGAMARKQGPSGAAIYIPWVLDDTTPEQRRRFLAAMPAPVTLINRLLWEPRYRKQRLWAA